MFGQSYGLLSSNELSALRFLIIESTIEGRIVRFKILVQLKVGSINSIFYFLHKTAEPFNCLEQDNLA